MEFQNHDPSYTGDMKNENAKAKAVAIKYDPQTDAAPVIAAAGQGVVAENIIRLAKESKVPIVEDVKTADLLSQLSVGDAIPPALYQVVAEILIFITNTDSKAAEKLGKYKKRG